MLPSSARIDFGLGREAKSFWVMRAAWFAFGLTTFCVSAAEIPPAERRSGAETMGAGTQAMQGDDTINPGMLWVQDGADLWTRTPSTTKPACAGCHGDAAKSMRGVAARYPTLDERSSGPIDLETRINRCRSDHQGEAPLPHESLSLIHI